MCIRDRRDPVDNIDHIFPSVLGLADFHKSQKAEGAELIHPSRHRLDICRACYCKYRIVNNLPASYKVIILDSIILQTHLVTVK